MKRMLGFLMFSIGTGMLIKIFLPNTVCVFLLISGMIGLGIWMFRDKNKSSRKWDRFFASLKKRRL